MTRKSRRITDRQRLDWLLSSDQLYRKPKNWWGENYTKRSEIDFRMKAERKDRKAGR